MISGVKRLRCNRLLCRRESVIEAAPLTMTDSLSQAMGISGVAATAVPTQADGFAERDAALG